MIIVLQTIVFFRESLLAALNRLLSPYYKRLRRTFSRYSTEEEEEDEEVFAEFDEEKGVVFYPPMYAQRYAAVSDCLMNEQWCGKLSKVVDLGYHDISFIKYLKDLPGVQYILGVDIESIPLRCSSDLLNCEDYSSKRENPLQVTLFQGNAADPDYRLIGCDAVVAIEMIEHMLPHDLDRVVHTIFGFIKPWVVIITTPNADFNKLFKSLEKNGLRRLDHFFEWTREQFHDWCSNIVCRYPQFTVTCQGVGPGPPGTEHHGCCSQLALFVNKDYVKQQDLNLDSLAFVSNVPSPENLAALVDGFESPNIDTERILSPNDNMESLTDCLYSNKQSCVTLMNSSSSPDFSMITIEYQDKTSQCNLDTEVGKNFLMFNDEDMYYTMLMPRRMVAHRVYEMEDVNSRLNCTTFQARKFSKTTQNLMAKNEKESFAHTREVVSEIRHLTKILNFNKESLAQRENGVIWCNINWGEDAPYWNQYYKVVRDYNYPFEQKSEECRILDRITEEINRLIDMHYEEQFTSDGNRLEIPIELLMKAVWHITNDVDKVKDLLEWNGYEVAGNFVIHSRIVVDGTSAGSSDVDWPENDTTSEIDTIDVQSTTISDGSALVPDIHGRYLRRALDKKVQALRKMLPADEDITTELDRVVCRLMKLALRTSIGKQDPPPPRWMQCKLLDLLTLTEKAIARRKKHYFENLPLQALGIDKNIHALQKKLKDDRATRIIVDKYNHLIQETEKLEIFDDLNFGFEDEMVEPFSGNEFYKDFRVHNISYAHKPYVVNVNNGEVSIVNENLELVSYVDQIILDRNSSQGVRKKYVCTPSRSYTVSESEKKSRKRHHSKITEDISKPYDKNSKSKKSKSNIVKKPVRAKISLHSSLKTNGKKIVNERKNYALKSRRIKAPKKLKSTASKPIPGSLIELSHPEVNLLLHSKTFQYSSTDKPYKGHGPVKNVITDVAATEESVIIDIVMDDMEETIALRRSIGTDADLDCAAIEQEILPNIVNVVKKDSSYSKLHVSSENSHSQTIFLYDINEPSTSKGVRHINMDVQCGTDTVLSPSRLITPPASVTKLPKMYSAGIRIGSLTNVAAEKKSMDFGTCTNNDVQNCDLFCNSSTIFSKKFKIENSQDDLEKKRSDFGTTTSSVYGECKCPPEEHLPKIGIKDPIRSVILKSSAVMNEETNFVQNCDIFYNSSRNFSKKIKIEDSQDNLEKKRSDFGTTTSSVYSECKCPPEEHSPKIGTKDPIRSVILKSSAVMNEETNFGNVNFVTNRTVNSTSEIFSNTGDLTSITPGSKSPDMFTPFRADDSLANLLINYNDYHKKSYKKNSVGCKSPNARDKSPNTINKSYNPRATGIKIIDSSTDNKIENKTVYGPSTTDDLKINNDASKPESPVVLTRVKMIDVVSEVSIEQNTDIGSSSQLSSSEPCKLVNSRYVPEKSAEFRFKIKNSLHVKQSQSSHNEEFDKAQQSVEIIEPSITKMDCLKNQNTCAGMVDNGHNFTENFKIGGSFTKVNIPRQKVIVQNDTLEDANTLPQTKRYGFKVKDSDENVIKKVEFSTTRVELLSDTIHYWNPTRFVTSRTGMLEPVLSKVKMEDSASEFYSNNYCSSPKSLWHGTISSVNTNEFKIKQSLSGYINFQNRLPSTREAQGKLSCGGFHIHSFKEKQISEDIVYQGEWKRQATKVQRKLYHGNTIIAKNVPESGKKAKIKKSPFKEKLQIKKIETKYEIKNEPKKPLRIRNTKTVKAKQEVINKSEQMKKVALPNLAKAIRANNKTSTKVASKLMTSTITSKNIKSIRSAKKPSNCVTLTQIVNNDCGVKSEPIKKQDIDWKYLPPYLRKRRLTSRESKINTSNESNKTATIKVHKKNIKEDLLSPKTKIEGTEDIKSDLIKIQDDPRSNINYMVFRNDIENTSPPTNSSQSADITSRNDNNNRRRVTHKRSSSPISQTSSTCSTSDSISTVRATNNWARASRRHSTSSNKSSIANTDSETSPIANKNRKFSKKCKVNKKADGRDQTNKENLPESSNKCYPENDMCLQNIKSSFLGRSKNMFMAKLKDSNLALNEKHQTITKSSIKIPAVTSNEEKKEPKTANIPKKKSPPSADSSTKKDIIRNPDGIQSEASNLVLLIEPQKEYVKMKQNIPQPEEPVLKVVDSTLLTEWFERGKISAIDSENTENAILAQMRQLVEERLDFIGNSLNTTFDDSLNTPFDDNMSQLSYRTVVPACDTDLNNTLKSEIENAMNHSLDAVLGDESDFSLQNESATATDVDLISFKSVTSASRYSDYYLAESDTSRIASPSENKTQSSVVDIFERKALTPLVQHAPGTLAVQAFSGFPMNVDRVMGDQPDYMNAIDSLTVDVTRQATSEEMFVSGRSSETYESCVLEEEVSVPDWLFHVMNPQLVINQRPDSVASFDSETGSPAPGFTRPRPQIDEEDDQQELVPLRMPMAEPAYDVNGNVVEPGIGLGAGAGDGHGMHSDHSQDSSGRGSSLSSTDASSGQQSEAILIDPSAFTTQFELFHEPVGSSMAVTTLVVPVGSPEPGRQGRNEAAIVSTSRNVTIRAEHPPLTSDGEADVSSLDTDVLDSS